MKKLTIVFILIAACGQPSKPHPQERGCSYEYYTETSAREGMRFGDKFAYKCQDGTIVWDHRSPKGFLPGQLNVEQPIK